MSQTIDDRPVKPIGAVVLTVVALAATGAAVAAPPAQFHVVTDVQLVDDQTCAFPITLSYHVTSAGRDFFDNSGNWIGAVVEQNTVGTDTANGVSLPDADHFVDHWTAQGDRETGLVIHVALPGGGVLIRDAGNIQFGWDGSITFVRGPHPLILGDTAAYCAAFG